jgi:protocatechuate 3,4-dioxygenase beta subunit
MKHRGWRRVGWVLLAVTAALTACSSGGATAAPTRAGSTSAAEATPRSTTTATAVPCAGEPTVAQTEGPYYKAGAPEVTTLVDDQTSGDLLLLTGQVMTTDCEALAGAVVDVWQADEHGEYDNVRYRMRGRVVADAEGRYILETVIPGEYPGRTPHIHVKVFGPDGSELLTTQIYLTGLSEQVADSIFLPELLARELPADSDGRRVVAFDIVVAP